MREKSIVKKLIELLFPSDASPKYYVDSPIWGSVSEQEIHLLSVMK